MTTAQESTSTIDRMWTRKTARDAGEKCPVCGAPMRETLRAQEARSVFIWYECGAPQCQGRKLKQFVQA